MNSAILMDAAVLVLNPSGCLPLTFILILTWNAGFLLKKRENKENKNAYRSDEFNASTPWCRILSLKDKKQI